MILWIFLLGALLLSTGAIGGGFEVRELKVPKVGAFSRIVAAGVGGVLIVLALGLYVSETNPAPPEAARPIPERSAPTPPPAIAPVVENPVPIAPDVQPDPGALTPEQRQVVTEFVFRADKAEIDAYRYGDAGYLDDYYAGDALTRLQRDIDDVNQRGMAMVMDIDTGKSYVADARLTEDGIFSLDMCEYWKDAVYDRQSGALLKIDPLAVVPQTINIQEVDGQPYITSVAFHTGRAFCN